MVSRDELAEILDREGINPNSYALDGGHPSERYVLDVGPNGCAVYYSERGRETGRREFATEDEACRHLLDTLRQDRTTHFHLVVGPLPAAEADAAFESWKTANGLADLAAEDVRMDEPALGAGRRRRYWVRGARLPST